MRGITQAEYGALMNANGKTGETFGPLNRKIPGQTFGGDAGGERTLA
jgi:hypothetical protein